MGCFFSFFKGEYPVLNTSSKFFKIFWGLATRVWPGIKTQKKLFLNFFHRFLVLSRAKPEFLNPKIKGKYLRPGNTLKKYSMYSVLNAGFPVYLLCNIGRPRIWHPGYIVLFIFFIWDLFWVLCAWGDHFLTVTF